MFWPRNGLIVRPGPSTRSPMDENTNLERRKVGDVLGLLRIVVANCLLLKSAHLHRVHN